MDDRIEKAGDATAPQPPASPNLESSAETETRTPTPAEIEAYRKALEEVSRQRLIEGMTTDEYMRLIRDDI
jgi:hypothetical protein